MAGALRQPVARAGEDNDRAAQEGKAVLGCQVAVLNLIRELHDRGIVSSWSAIAWPMSLPSPTASCAAAGKLVAV